MIYFSAPVITTARTMSQSHFLNSIGQPIILLEFFRFSDYDCSFFTIYVSHQLVRDLELTNQNDLFLLLQ